jgi:hypothetical protein
MSPNHRPYSFHCGVIVVFALLLTALACSPQPQTTINNEQPREASTMPTASKFTFEYNTVAGPEISDGLQQYQSTLKIDSTTSMATLESCRAAGDGEGIPIGRFEIKMTAAELEEIAKQAAALKSIPSTQQGGLGASAITLRYRSDATQWEHILNSNDPNQLATANNLQELLNLLIGRLYTAPVAALVLEVARGPNASAPFKVRLRNIGKIQLAVFDPRSLRRDDADAWAGVRVAAFPPKQPGVTSLPPQWEQLELNGSDSAQPRNIIMLPAGGQLEWPTRAWTPSQAMRKESAGRYLVQAIIADYTGPSLVDDQPRLRGALFSESLIWQDIDNTTRGANP